MTDCGVVNGGRVFAFIRESLESLSIRMESNLRSEQMQAF